MLKPQGIIIMTTPNRHFCVDIGHGSNFLGLRFHSPSKDFILSFTDIKKLFLQIAGCSEIFTLPYKNFITWDLYIKNFLIIRALLLIIRGYLKVIDLFSFLRQTFLSPHLIIAIRK